MSALSIEHFDTFFAELHDGKKPFPWQRNLAARVLEQGWPEVIDLPTASGKTACIDIALFALACKATSPRRIFFVVDRRVVVNEASLRMRSIAGRLKNADEGVIGQVARRLREMAGDVNVLPLSVHELRGGIYRDESWVRNPLQPAVIASTVDQVGSRLLFRGYGVTQSVLPIHAALIANDALILLDEAHCSKAFAQTLFRIKDYRGERWSTEPLKAPFASVEMTATPSRSPADEPFRLSSEDRDPMHLGKRLRTPKKTRLVSAKGRADDYGKLASVLVQEALKVAESAEVKRIVIMVNRVLTARLVFADLNKDGRRADLVIGRMRPIDRDHLNECLEPLKSGKPRMAEAPPWFIVATQCLEVGADLDFDALITECASIDALLQRFGRLDRLGEFGRSAGRIVALAGQVDGKQSDSVYGGALKETWDWLNELAANNDVELNFGIETEPGGPQTVPQMWNALERSKREAMTIVLPAAPVLLPAHLDALVQTSPRPCVEPSIDLFLHGPQRGNADVQVVWRADLDEKRSLEWKDIVAAAPPVSAEAMPVAIYSFNRWLRETLADDSEPDLEGVNKNGDRDLSGGASKKVLIWRGDKSEIDLEKLRPGDTVVIPESYKGWDELGHVPDGVEIDCADRAFHQSRRKIRLRLHPELIKRWPQRSGLAQVGAVVSTEGFLWSEMQDAFKAYQEETEPKLPNWLGTAISEIVSKREKAFLMSTYPGGLPGVVIEGRARIRPGAPMEEDADDDEMSVGSPVHLDRHLKDVHAAAEKMRPLVSPQLADAVEAAAKRHDYGKADSRFQAVLHGGDRLAARFAPHLLAKGRFLPGDYRTKCERSALPESFRHELISLLMVTGEAGLGDQRDLILHLIASHHGRCRPLAPVVCDDVPEPLSLNGLVLSIRDRIDRAAHRLDSGVADRFWALTRRFGWWGLSYLETLLRLSDWNASAEEEERGEGQ